MASETELLTSIIEFSIGLAGFSGVIAAMSRHTAWSTLEKFRVENILLCSLIPAFLSFAALGLSTLQPDSVNSWRQSCLLSAVSMFAVVLKAYRGRAALPESQRNLLRMRAMYLLTGSLTIMGIVQLLVFTGVLMGHSFVLFYIGLVLILLVGVFLFSIAIFSLRDESTVHPERGE